jgi:hypothetical protein
MSHELPPLPPDLRALLDAEATAPLPGMDTAKARVLDGVLARVGGGGGPSGGAPVSSPAGWSASAVFGAGLAGILLGALGGLAVGFAIWWTPAVVSAPRAEPVAVDRAPPAEVPAAPPVLPREAAAPSSVAPAAPVVVPPVAPEPDEPEPEPAAPALDSERAIIDQGRVALRRGRPLDAMVAMMSHERRFPDGDLAEERDRLAIEALVVLGRVDEAVLRAAEFRERYPKSVHLPALEGI